MKKTILVFALLIVALITIFKISKYSILFGKTSLELIIAIIAVVFFIIGIYINKKSLHKPLKSATEIDAQKEISDLKSEFVIVNVVKQIHLGYESKSRYLKKQTISKFLKSKKRKQCQTKIFSLKV